MVATTHSTSEASSKLTLATIPIKKTSNQFLLRVVAISISLLVASLGSCFAFLWYILHGKVEWTSDELVTTVSQGNVLLITTIISKVILTLFPAVFGIAAYWVADGWRVATTATTTNHKLTKSILPTPYQYSLLLQIFRAASPWSFWTTSQYLWKSTATRRNKTSKQLSQAFIVLCISLFLTYGLIGADFALHSLSTSRPASVFGASLDPNSTTNISGRKLKAECNNPSTYGTACTVNPSNVANTEFTVGFKEGYRILQNLSASTRVSLSTSNAATSDQETQPVVLLTDAAPPNNIAFTAATIGISTKCDVLTHTCSRRSICTEDQHPPSTHIRASYPCSVNSAYPCTPNGWPKWWMSGFYNASSMRISEPLERRNESEMLDFQIPPNDPPTGHNPFRVIFQSFTYVDEKMLRDVCAERSPSGACIRGKDEGYMYSGDSPKDPAPHYRFSLVGCTISVVEVDYSYLNGTYTVDHTTMRMANNATTWAISSVLYATDAPIASIEHPAFAFASSGGESSALANLIGEKASHLLLSMSHSAFETTPVLAARSVQHQLTTVLPTSTLVTFFAFILGFASFVVVLAIMALTSSREAFVIGNVGNRIGSIDEQTQKATLVSMVEVASQRLREPSGLIYKVFEEEVDSEQRWAKEGIEMFIEGRSSRQRNGTAGGGRDVKVGLEEDGSFGFQ
ncbi:hypothetical protein FRC17_002039 [Serendipita sp. 399]|nr:hypothetical protein FRC17_002039 [Serendipita sp. 399]